jgi:hypothetical protein
MFSTSILVACGCCHRGNVTRQQQFELRQRQQQQQQAVECQVEQHNECCSTMVPARVDPQRMMLLQCFSNQPQVDRADGDGTMQHCVDQVPS